MFFGYLRSGADSERHWANDVAEPAEGGFRSRLELCLLSPTGYRQRLLKRIGVSKDSVCQANGNSVEPYLFSLRRLFLCVLRGKRFTPTEPGLYDPHIALKCSNPTTPFFLFREDIQATRAHILPWGL